MEPKNYIPVGLLCSHYKVEVSFFNELYDVGLIEIVTIEQTQYLHQDKISDIEKMIRMHRELNVNIEGIDVIFNLLQKVNDLQSKLNATQNRLLLYENDIEE
jgi:hypothetical protein